MDASDPRVRVNFELLQRNIGRKVLLVGRIESIEGGKVARVTAADGGTVAVHIKPTAPFESRFAEFDGVVVDPTTVQAESHVSFGDNFDMNLYNDFVNLSSNQNSTLFA